MFKLQIGEEEFRIVGPDGEESDLCPLDGVAVLTIPEGPHAGSYVASVEDEELEETVYRLEAVPTETEDVEFETSGEEEVEEGPDSE